MSKKHMGSGIDDFMKEEGVFEEAQAHAVKEVVAWQLAEAMKKKKISKNRMAQLLKTIAAAAKAKDYDTVIKLGTEARDLFPDYVEAGSVYEFLAQAYLAKQNKAAAADELERYMKIGGRDPATLKTLADDLQAEGKKKEAAGVLERVNYIYPMDGAQHQQLGLLLLDLNNNAEAIREFQAVLARDPIDPAQAHFNLARAYNQNHQTEQAKDELISSLEAAPGFRPAQKLLLELSGPEK